MIHQDRDSTLIQNKIKGTVAFASYPSRSDFEKDPKPCSNLVLKSLFARITVRFSLLALD